MRPSNADRITISQRIRGEGISPGPPSPAASEVGQTPIIKGDLLVQGKIKWESGRAFFASLVHAITAARTYTFPDSDGNIPALPTQAITETGSGAIVRTTSPTIVTPIVASLTNMNHNHQNGAGGGLLDAGAINTGTFADARLSANVALLNTPNTFSAFESFPNGFQPRVFSSLTIPLTGSMGSSELAVWHNTTAGTWNLIFNTGTSVVKVALA